MDVRLPDGTIINNVPDGTTQAELRRRLALGGHTLPEPEIEPVAPAKDPVTGLDPTAQAFRSQPSSDPLLRSTRPFGTSNRAMLVPQAPQGPPGIFEQAQLGLRHAGDRTKAGLERLVQTIDRPFTPKGMVPDDISPTDRQRLEQGAAFVKQTGPASTIGQIGGDLALGAIPVAGTASVLTRAAALARAGSWAPAIGNVASNAAYAAAIEPDDKSRAALLGGGGAVAGRVLTRAAGQIVRPRAGAQAELNKGTRLTPGQAGGGVMGTAADLYERGMMKVPILKNSVASIRNARGEAMTDAGNTIVQAPPGSPPLFGPKIAPQPGTLHESVNALNTTIKETTDKLSSYGMDAAKLSAFGYVASHVFGIPISGLVLLGMASRLGATDVGRKVILGQYPLQKFIMEHPEIATQLGAALSRTNQPKEQQ